MSVFKIEKCKLEASKHFKNTWMRKWDWDYPDIRQAVENAYKIERIGKRKYEVYTRKKGEKKLIIVYYWEYETIFVITGGEG